jgi:hypothetical protein
MSIQTLDAFSQNLEASAALFQDDQQSTMKVTGHYKRTVTVFYIQFVYPAFVKPHLNLKSKDVSQLNFKCED